MGFYIRKQPVPPTIEAWQLTPDTLKFLAKWCNGSIKGTKLPVEEQVIDIWDSFYDCEIRAEMGDYIIKHYGYFSVMTSDKFVLIYQELKEK